MNLSDEQEKRTRLAELLQATKDAAIEGFPAESRKMVAQILELHSTLNAETDRGAALMAASFLEATLKDVLLMRLVDDQKVLRDAFEHRGVAGSFTALIDLSYLVGILSKAARRDLHLLRLVRNEFSHVAGSISFATHSINQRCKALKFAGPASNDSGRVRFTRAVMAILGHLTLAAADMVRLTAKAEPRIPGEETRVAVAALIKNITGLEVPLAG